MFIFTGSIRLTPQLGRRAKEGVNVKEEKKCVYSRSKLKSHAANFFATSFCKIS